MHQPRAACMTFPTHPTMMPANHNPERTKALTKLACVVAMMMLQKQFATPEDAEKYIRSYVSRESDVLAVSMIVAHLLTEETAK